MSAALAFHGMAINGGVDHALDVLDTDQIAAATFGYRYLGLEPAVHLIEKAAEELRVDDADDDVVEELNDKYGQLFPDDETLFRQFVLTLQSHPDDFAPV